MTCDAFVSPVSFVSIVIINYNQGRFLSSAIQSVLRQTYTEFELLIWDDGSSDRSLEIAQTFAAQDDRIQVISAPHQGLSRSRSQALARATGTYLGCVDADDVLSPTALAETVKILEEQPQIGWVYTDYQEMSAKGRVLGLGHRCRIPYSPQGLLINFMTFHFRLIRRSLYAQVTIDPGVDQVDDYDLCLRLSELSEPYHLAKPLYYYRQHSRSLSHTQRLQQIQESEQVVQSAIVRRGLDSRYQLSVDYETGVFVLLPKLSYVRQLVAQIGAIAAAIPLTIALSLGSLLPLTRTAEAQSITPAADGVNTIVDQQDNQYDITGGTQAGQNLFHSFYDFGLNTGETANFISPSTDIANILGRVTSGNPSLINGLIQISGGGSPNLFLMNPAGMVFGADARLNLPGSFTATTATGIGLSSEGTFNALDGNNFNLLVGTPNRFDFATLLPSVANTDVGAIFNWADLSVQPGQSLSLFGRSLFNAGTLSASGGTVNTIVVPQGESLKLSQPGMVLELELAPQDGFVIPVEHLKAIDLPLLLTEGQTQHAQVLEAQADGSYRITSGTLVNTGSFLALGEDSQVLAKAPRVSISGDVSVAGTPLERGGRILLLGDQVNLIDANLDASGGIGGGTILVGGDLRGQGDLPQASQTTVNTGTVLSADGGRSGDGGQIVVWSKDTTRFEGWASARGGTLAGNGGLIELSGKNQLQLGNWFQRVDLAAPTGVAGTLLFDPIDISITSVSSSNPITLSGDPTTISINTLLDDDISNFLENRGSLEITTSAVGGYPGDITLSNATIDWTSANNLKLKADRSITLTNGNITSKDGDIVLEANTAGTATGSFDGISLAETSTLSSTNGAISLTATGGTGSNFQDGVNLGKSSQINSVNGDITIVGSGSTSSSGVNNRGIRASGTIESTGTGAGAAKIRLTGTGGAGTNNNDGVFTDSAGTIRSAYGDITIVGYGSPDSTGSDNLGILTRGRIESTGTGADAANITLTGTGGAGTDNNDGVYAASSGTIRSSDGDITIVANGSTSSTGSSNRGIDARGTIASTGTGSIDLTGTGGRGADNNDGVLNIGSIQTTTGNITIEGTGSLSTGNNNDGIQTIAGSITTSTGTIALEGTRGAGTNYNRSLNLSGTINANNSITLTGNGTTNTSGTFNEGVRFNYGTVSSTAGTVSITGTAGAGTGSRYSSTHNSGVVVGQYGIVKSSSTTVNEGIEIKGYGTTDTNATTDSHGVDIQGTIQTTNAAGVTITGFGGAGTDSNFGVRTGSSSDITSVDGDITIDGTGSTLSTGSNNRGISAEGTIASTGSAQIALTGTGGAGTSSNHGVATSFTTSSIASVDGDITIEGTGSTVSTQINNRGVSLQGTIASTGTGTNAANITITGTGGAGTSFNDGVFTYTTITSGYGDITIVGNGSTLSTGSSNRGINAQGTIESTGTGAGAANITLTGTGGAGTYNNDGVFTIYGTFTSIDGDITIVGDATNENDGVAISTYSDFSNSTGTITITGNTNQLSTGVSIVGASIDTYNLQLRGNAFRIANGSGDSRTIVPSITGNGGTLAFQALSTSSRLTLTFTTLNAFNTGGFSQIDLGRPGDTGTVNLIGSFSFSDPLTIWSQNANFTLNDALIGSDNGSVTIEGSGNTTILNANIITPDNPIIINDSVILGTDVILSTSGTGAPITITGAIDGTSGTEQLLLYAGTGAIDLQGTIGSTTTIGGLTLQSTQTTTLAGLSINGNLVLDTPVELSANTVFEAGTGTIDFRRTVDTQGFDLTLTADNIDFSNGGAGVIFGGGNLLLQPFTTTRDIYLGGTPFGSPLLLSDTDIDALADGFSRITIGRADGSGAISFGSNLTFLDPVLLQMPTGLGSINTSGGSQTAEEGIELRTGQTLTLGALTVNGGDLIATSNQGRVVVNGSLNNTGTGQINLSGNNTGSSTGSGIQVNNTSTITTDGGDIILTGSTSEASAGVNIQSGIVSNNGDVSIDGSSTQGTGLVVSSGGFVNAGTGNIVLTGTSTGTGTLVHGVYLSSGLQFGNNITITGNSTGSVTADGVLVSGGSTFLSSQSDLTIVGTGTAGVKFLNSGLVEAEGNLRLTGSSTNSQDGIIIDNSSLTAGGILTLNANQTHFFNSASLSGTGTTALNLFQLNSTANLTVLFNSVTSPLVTSNFGQVTIGQSTGTSTVRLRNDAGGSSTVAFTDSLLIQSLGAIETTSVILESEDNIIFNAGSSITAGDITNTAAATIDLTAASVTVGDIQANPVSGTATIVLTGDEINFDSIASNGGLLTLKPLTASQLINLGEPDTNLAGTLDFTGTDLNNLADGFAGITIGRADGTGTVQLGTGFTVSDPMTIVGNGFTLEGADVATIFTLSSGNAGSISGGNLTFGSGASLNFSGAAGIQAGIGNDTFSLLSGVTASLALDGGTGLDLLNYSNFTTPVAVDLSSGLFTNITTLANVESFRGGSSLSDRFSLRTGNNSVSVTSSSGGVVNSATVFDAFETIVGNTGNDTFAFSDGVTFAGTIAGGDGTDTLNYESYTTDPNISLSTLATTTTSIEVLRGSFSTPTNTLRGQNIDTTWNVNGNGAGVVDGFTFTRFNQLIGGSANDTFTIAFVGSVSSLDGGLGTDEVRGAGVANTWNISSSNGGTVGLGNAFTNIEQLTGGTNNDTFVFSDGVTFAGTIAGNSGFDTLDYQAFTSPLTIDLGTIASGIEFVQGTSNANSTLIGQNIANTWTVQNSNGGTVNGLGFATFNILQGGTNNDTFAFNDGVTFAGTIAGGDGSDTLNYQAYTSALTIDLSTIASDIELIEGTSNADSTLIGQNVANTWTVQSLDSGTVNGLDFATFNILQGGTNNDTFALISGGTVTGAIDGGSGSDSLTGDNVTNTFSITGANSGTAT